MEKLNFAFFVILICANIAICRAFLGNDEIDVNKAVKFYNRIPGLSWKAGSNGFGKTIKLSQIKSKLGFILKHKESQHSATSRDNGTKEVDNLPKNYDCRTAFPHCTTIRSIKDQSNCGSCWAVSVASTFSDRLCIHSAGKINYNMSAEQLMACDEKSHGCKGGHIDTAWRYIADKGLVTGGDYGSKEGCLPYSIPPSRSFFDPSPETPKCRKNITCPVSYRAENKTIIQPKSMEYQIRKEIYKNGPLTTGFMVYLSFQFYEKGIYSRLFIDLPMGGHAVRVIGWGEERGQKYWLVANSWGTEWGEQGTFRIRRGNDECGFESNMIAGLPRLKH